MVFHSVHMLEAVSVNLYAQVMSDHSNEKVTRIASHLVRDRLHYARISACPHRCAPRWYVLTADLNLSAQPCVDAERRTR